MAKIEAHHGKRDDFGHEPLAEMGTSEVAFLPDPTSAPSIEHRNTTSNSISNLEPFFDPLITGS